jgi:hypothetical protein
MGTVDHSRARHAELSLSTAGDNDFCFFAQKAFGSGKAKTGRLETRAEQLALLIDKSSDRPYVFFLSSFAIYRRINLTIQHDN